MTLMGVFCTLSGTHASQQRKLGIKEYIRQHKGDVRKPMLSDLNILCCLSTNNPHDAGMLKAFIETGFQTTRTGSVACSASASMICWDQHLCWCYALSPHALAVSSRGGSTCSYLEIPYHCCSWSFLSFTCCKLPFFHMLQAPLLSQGKLPAQSWWSAKRP